MKLGFFYSLLEVSTTDPNERRRARLLNILLLGIGFLTLLAILLTIIFISPESQQDSIRLLIITACFLIGLIIAFALNQYGFGQSASWLLLGLLTIAFVFSDIPEEVVFGRVLYLFTLPILMASVLIRPYSSFIMAISIGVLLNGVALIELAQFNFVAPIGFMAVALVSWLSARSLEEALADLQELNQQLEKHSDELEKTNKLLRQENMERKRAETELAEQAKVLRRTNAELQQFAYISTHDLREPLRKVRSYTELLERRYQGQLDEKADKYINYIVSGATRMQTLITDLLAYLKVGDDKLSFQLIDLNQILTNVLNDLDILIQENTAVITHDSLPTVEADPTQMTHLLQNLLSNAIKFRRDEPPAIHIGAERQNGEWLFAVSDNGIGLEEQFAERIFVIFQRLYTKERYPGTGIGLAICKKVIENHNGRIWLESQPGQGTTFYFTLPV